MSAVNQKIHRQTAWALTAVALLVSVSSCTQKPPIRSEETSFHTSSNIEKPKYGRPAFDPDNGYDWTFYRHFDGIDWYLAPKSKDYFSGGFKIMMRSVEPSNINFGPLSINCSDTTYSAYYEPYEAIDLSRKNLVTSLYKSNCNLPPSYE